jgi:hypothetical protein
LVGFGLFAGYYDHDDLIHSVLCEFNGETCYKTGDLGWFNITNKQLEFRGHRKYQVKLEPIETEKIKAVVMEVADDCVILETKYNNSDHLVAYVQTIHSVHDLRQYCLNRLPLYMVPSIFMILDTLPTNQNGEIDQGKLPSPDFTCLPVLSNADKLPRTEMEQRVQKIWYQVLSHIDRIISISTSFFSLGDEPKLFIKLFHLYSANFKHNLPITTFLNQPTIAEHAHLLLENATPQATGDKSQSMKIMEGQLDVVLYFSSTYFYRFNHILHIFLYFFYA